jgi:arginyl-tRNA synthetase
VFLQTAGTLAGCWVMKVEEEPDARLGVGSRESGVGIGDSEDEEREKVIVRSNGTVTYIGKDIAYQFWKFGLLGRDFFYRPFGTRVNGDTLWTTSADSTEGAPPRFGGASATYNVIDVRQSYLQKLLKQTLRTLGYAEQAEHATHFSYETVALSPATARTLGYLAAGAPDDKRGFVEVSGRRGQGVKADDLLDMLISHAETEVAKRNPEFGAAEHRRIAEMIAVAAVRYFMLK